jgi:hypothetical protein
MFNASRPMVSFVASLSLVTFVSFVSPSEACGQTTDVVGVRAQGMGGAFTAVADDATAGWWNPAGLAGGAFFNSLIEYGRPDRSSGETVKGIAVAYPALGLTYYRLPVSQIRVKTSTGADPAGREDQGVLSLYGVTVGQSLGQHLVVGSTVKLLHAGDTHPDLDIGAMATFGPVRIGATLRNVTEPAFGSATTGFTLERHARAGFAVTSGKRGVIGSATLAVDADLTAVHSIRGDERFVAVGAEAWGGQRTLGIRGGVSRNAIGHGETLLSGGVSAAVRRGTFVDAYASTGDEARHGWGLALRVTF